MATAIEASALVKTYPPDVRALDGLSLSVQTGTIFALLGPNGAGKSTTVRILTTLSRADSGSARVAGVDVREEPTAVRRAIGVVGQKAGSDPEATGRENLVLQGELYGISGRELQGRVDDALERFGNVARVSGWVWQSRGVLIGAIADNKRDPLVRVRRGAGARGKYNNCSQYDHGQTGYDRHHQSPAAILRYLDFITPGHVRHPVSRKAACRKGCEC